MGEATNHRLLNQTIYITNNVRQSMLSHCKQEYPFEACGLISGKSGVAESIWPMENVNRSPISYSMDLDQISKVFDLIDKRHEYLMGIYHSHPTGNAFPSKADIVYNNYPEVGHFIVSLANSTPEIKCFQIKGEMVIPLFIKWHN